MSPWSADKLHMGLADELHVALSPSQVGVVQVRRRLSLNGLKREVIAKQNLACDSDNQVISWDWAVQAMDKLLSQYAGDRPNVIVVLSNHFVRYAIVPWSDLISSDEQQLAYTRHCFQTTYGAMAAAWELRLSRSAVGTSQLASAVEEPLLAACQDAVKRHGLRLNSVQPYLMSAFNRLKRQIQQTDAWFALAEPGNMCLAQLHQGQWKRFRAARLSGGWEEFTRFLGREAFMGDSVPGEQHPEEQVLYLYAPHLGHVQAINGWKIYPLRPPMPPNLPEEEDSSLVMALSA